tara:strand:- start:85316 stop:86260 length:945 start_codon:yes stop_codon:yes gene_type:complete
LKYGKVLVTGSSGVLGYGFKKISVNFPSTEFVFSNSSDCDLTNIDQTNKYIKNVNPDAIIHLAAFSGGVALTKKYPAKMLKDNLLMTLNILEACINTNIQKILLTLSSGMYPPEASIPIKEEYIHDGAAHESNYSYSYAKRIMDPAIKAYREEFGLNVVGLVPNGIFGEFDDFRFESAVMVSSLIRRFYENTNSGENIVVWGDGSPLREYTYSEDLANIFLWCLENYDSSDILNVGSTEEHSVKEIAFMISDILGIDKSRIIFDESKPNGVHRKSTDNSNFLKLSHHKYTPFREGIEKTIEWFKANYPSNVRID